MKLKRIIKNAAKAAICAVRLLQKPFLRLRKTKKLLILCLGKTMEEHCLDYYEQVKSLKRVKCYLIYLDSWHSVYEKTLALVKGTDIVPLKSYALALVTVYDLVVNADLPYIPANNVSKHLYINHGLGGISYDGGKTKYEYGKYSYGADGKPLYDVYLDGERGVAESMSDTPFGNRIVYTGFKYADRIKSEIKNYAFYREKLNIAPDETLVAVFSSWNKDSLFHVLGEGIIDEFRRLMKEKKYRFVLSVHPLEYTEYSKEIKPLGKYIDSLESEGFIIRRPDDDFMPYLIASDAVFCDYTSIGRLAPIAEKKIVLSEFKDERVWDKSVIRKLNDSLPKVSDAHSFAETVEKALAEPLSPVIKEADEAFFGGVGFYGEKVREVTKSLLRLK